MNLFYNLQEDEFPIIPEGDEPGKTDVDVPEKGGSDGSRLPSSFGRESEGGKNITPPPPPENPRSN